MLMPLISAQMGDNLKVSKISVTVLALCFHFLNQAHAWFLEIDSVQTSVCVHVCVFMCVRPQGY